MAYKEITRWVPTALADETVQPVQLHTHKQYPYIYSHPVVLIHIHLERKPNDEERKWLAEKAFPEERPRFRAGNGTLEWVFGEQEAKREALFVHDVNLF